MHRRFFSLVEFFVASSLFILAFSMTLSAYFFYQRATEKTDAKLQRVENLHKARQVLHSILLGARNSHSLPEAQPFLGICFFLPGNLDRSIEMMQDHYVKLQLEEGQLILKFQAVYELSKESKIVLLKEVSDLSFSICSYATKGLWEGKQQIRLTNPEGLIRIRGNYRKQSFEWILSMPDHMEITKDAS